MPELQAKTTNVAATEDEDRTKKREEATEEDDHSTLKEETQADESMGDEQQDGEKRPAVRRMREREPIVLDRGVTGTVKWFSMAKGLLYILDSLMKTFNLKVMGSSASMVPKKKWAGGLGDIWVKLITNFSCSCMPPPSFVQSVAHLC